MSFAAILSDPFFTATYTLTRTTIVAPVNGRKQAGAVTTPSIVACIQPLTPREVQLLPDVERTEEARKVYTTSQLYPRTDSYEPDRITIGSDTYEVISVAGPFHFGDFYKAIVKRVVTTV